MFWEGGGTKKAELRNHREDKTGTFVKHEIFEWGGEAAGVL